MSLDLPSDSSSGTQARAEAEHTAASPSLRDAPTVEASSARSPHPPRGAEPAPADLEQRARAEAARVRSHRGLASQARRQAVEAEAEAERVEAELHEEVARAAPARQRPRPRPRRTMPLKSLSLFTLQLGVMMRASVHVVRALSTLADSEDARVRPAALAVLEQVTQGRSLSDAMSGRPDCFDRIYVKMIKTGETGGCLHEVLEDLSRSLDRQERIRGRVQSALMYPAFTVLVSAGMVAFLLYYMLPRFLTTLNMAPDQLPWLTRVLMQVASQPAVTLGVPLGLILTLLVLQLQHQDALKGLVQWLKYESPLVGSVNRSQILARVCHNVGLLLARGVPLAAALRTQSDCTGYARLDQALGRVVAELEQGEELSAAMAREELLPPLVLGLVGAGEQTGDVGSFLLRCASNLEEQVELSTASMLQLIEPMLLLGLGLGVGTIVMAVFLPIYRLATVNL